LASVVAVREHPVARPEFLHSALDVQTTNTSRFPPRSSSKSLELDDCVELGDLARIKEVLLTEIGPSDSSNLRSSFIGSASGGKSIVGIVSTT
jgi:hypothetical protein